MVMQLRGGFSLLLLSCAAFLGVTAQQNATQNVSMAGNQTTTTVDPLANLPPSLQNCPQWLYDYVRWHKQQRSNESAFRVTWSDERGGRGMGYGDRLRGAVHGLKSAASSARVFQLRWMNAPLDLLSVFEPNLIDWRPIPGQDTYDSGLSPSETKNATIRSIFYGGNPYCSWDPPSWLFMPPERWANTTNKDRIRLDWECGCLFRALFKPTAELSRLIDEEQARVLPSGTANYTGVHFRVYAGMKGEGENAPEHERLLNVTGNAEFLRTVECARKRTGNPAVFAAISDVAARRAIKQGLLPGVYGPSQEWALHPNSDNFENVTERPKPSEHMHTFVEMGMLARAAHGIWSTSGFSNIARWWQGGGAERNFVIERSRDGPGCYSFSEVGGPNMV